MAATDAREPLLKRGEFGEKLDNDPSWTGIKHEGRSFQDILFGLLFLLTVAGLIWTAALGFERGNVQLLLDYESNQLPDDVTDNLKEYLLSTMGKAIGQVKKDANVLIGVACLALVLAFVWTMLLRFFTKLFIYLTLFAGIAMLAALSVFLLTLSRERNEDALMWVAVAGFIITGILILVVLFMHKKIALTALMMSESTKGVQHNPMTLLLTAVMAVLFLGFAAFWTAAMCYLYTVQDERLRNALYFNVFAFFWITGFLSAVVQMTVAGAVASWYFSRSANGAQGAPCSPSLTTFARAFTKSLGSLALGTLIAAIVAFINWLLQRAKSQTTNRIVRFVICCIQCCVGCLQGLVSFVNKFAFIYVAMYGESYCTSAKNVYHLMQRNVFSIVVVDFIGDFVLLVGKVLGTAVCTVTAVAILDDVHRTISGVTFVLVIVISFAVFHLFGHVLGIGLDAVFVCYLEDLERNDSNKRYYMTPEVHDKLASHAQQLRNS